MKKTNIGYSINDLENPILRNALNEYSGKDRFIYSDSNWGDKDKKSKNEYSEGTPGGDRGLLTTILWGLFGR